MTKVDHNPVRECPAHVTGPLKRALGMAESKRRFEVECLKTCEDPLHREQLIGRLAACTEIVEMIEILATRAGAPVIGYTGDDLRVRCLGCAEGQGTPIHGDSDPDYIGPTCSQCGGQMSPGCRAPDGVL